MSGFEFQLSAEQMAEVQKDLDGLAADLQAKAVRAGLVKAVSPIKRAAKRNVPVLSGDLRKSIGHRLLSKSARGRLGIANDRVAIVVGPTRKVGGYAQDFVAGLVESGVEPSTRTVRRNLKGHQAHKRDGKWVTYTYRHPGQKAEPFLGPALRENGDEMDSRFYQGLTRYLEKHRA
ncbi:HK97-gp10 family putative phage morphogenesis protein [Modicisalibacter coralii]|uniref:HK97-gp10 family putative phage morphogenesis protein n=1 Tax=Modicisalibacter coralii TaxID=2304602 RepID=UPI00139679B0|nr:HK97-gp10 family putative phage morphogenesis protein [Halomonas coralii]